MRKVLQTVKEALLGKELIPEFTIDGPKKAAEEKAPGWQTVRQHEHGVVPAAAVRAVLQRMCRITEKKARYPEPFEKIRSQLIAEANSPYEIKYPQRDRRSGLMKPVTGSIVSAGDNASQPKPPMSEKIPVPEKALMSEKAPVSENTSMPEKAPVSENTLMPEKVSVSENTSIPEKDSGAGKDSSAGK